MRNEEWLSCHVLLAWVTLKISTVVVVGGGGENNSRDTDDGLRGLGLTSKRVAQGKRRSTGSV